MKPDNRVINLTKKIPDYIPWPSEPLQLTLCAGDGVQSHNDIMVTDIEWFTMGIEGYSRETKPTNVFCCSPDYNPSGLRHNMEYMEQHKELDILLVLCDTMNDTQLQKFSELFSNRIDTIREDMACYGPALSPEILQKVLVNGGKYILDDFRKIRTYPRNEDISITYDAPEYNKLIITKRSSLSRVPTKKRQLAGKRRNKRREDTRRNKRIRFKHAPTHREGGPLVPYKIEPANK